tara:strand:- start:98 stop:346 length:249 start_codon:yes stop_codon:yes gene_type:complete
MSYSNRNKKQMENKMKVEINNLRRKSLFWWRSLTKDMQLTMFHNPNVNKTELEFGLLTKSSIQIDKMFLNWIKWNIKEGEIK